MSKWSELVESHGWIIDTTRVEATIDNNLFSETVLHDTTTTCRNFRSNPSPPHLSHCSTGSLSTSLAASCCCRRCCRLGGCSFCFRKQSLLLTLTFNLRRPPIARPHLALFYSATSVSTLDLSSRCLPDPHRR